MVDAMKRQREAPFHLEPSDALLSRVAACRVGDVNPLWFDNSFPMPVILVDDFRVRNTIDIDFTNGAHHFSADYVPLGELWIGNAQDNEDHYYWALRQWEEYALMSDGMPYSLAFDKARAGELLARSKKEYPVRPIKKYLISETHNGDTIWRVSGFQVRQRKFIDFTLGGNYMVYPFIPKREIWIDDALREEEVPAIIVHECTEVKMWQEANLNYHEAHRLATDAERLFREKLDTYGKATMLKELGLNFHTW